MSNEYHCRPCGRTRTVENAEPVCPDCVHAIKSKLPVYEQGPDDAEVKEALKSADQVNIIPMPHAHARILARALRAERAKVYEMRNLQAKLATCEASVTPGMKKCPPHEWDRQGEQCQKCGQKDWM